VSRVIGSVVYPAADVTAPGCIRHIEGNRFSLAEIDNAETPRIAAVSAIFQRAGFKAPVVSNIRSEIWTKLWGNLSFNPISALTHATLKDLCRYPLTRELATAMMGEAQTIGEKLGIRFRVSIEKRIAGGEAVGAHKTSMLQDIEAGRPVEADALIGSIIELGRLTETPTPHIDSIYAVIKLLNHVLQTTHGRLNIAKSQM
jgi:2-dehydropantoate 2-reductase